MAITLPPSRILGDSGHVTDHATIRTALSDLDTAVAAKAPTVSPTFTGTVTLPATTKTGGLSFITSATITAASSVSVNSCFGSGFSDYRIELDITSTSSSADLTFNLRAGGSNNATTNSAWTRIYAGHSTYTPAGSGETGKAYWQMGTLNGSSMSVSADIFGPNLASATRMTAHSVTDRFGAGAYSFVQVGSGHDSAATQWDGFTFNFGASTTGVVRVFGYQNA